MRRIAIVFALVIASSLMATTLPSNAAGGLAWDQVTKFSMDGSIPEPNFAQDFQTASQPPDQPKQHGGMFGGFQNSINAAMGAMQMFKTGIAERHYVAGSFERTENVAQQTATITDCNARTITYLNLAKKTYRVVSMDQPQAPQAAPGKPSPQGTPSFQDDGTSLKIAYSSQALGPRQLDGTNTDGYKATMEITIMRPNESPQTMNTVLTEYVSSYAQPHQTCRSFHMPMGGGPGAMGAMGNNMEMTRMINEAMRTSSGNPRFTVTASGPALPSGRLDMFTVYQMAGQQSNGRGFVTIMERGNVHQIDDGDKSIFGVPPDFTKEM